MHPNLPPGPSALPIVQLARWTARPLEFLHECAARYGDSFTVRFPGFPPVVFTHAPDAVREVFTSSPDDLHAGEANKILEALLGRYSLLLMDGATHLRERKLMMPPFHGERMRAYGAAMLEAADAVIDSWPTDRAFPMQPSMQAATLDVILRTVFGVESGADKAPLRDALAGLIGVSASPALFVASLMLRPDKLMRVLTVGAEPIRVAGRGPDLSVVLPWRGAARLRRRVDELLFAEIAAARGATSHRDDVLSMLVSARDEAGAALSDEHLRDEMLTLLLAGHETTATSLSWAIAHLLAPPALLARLRAAVRTAVGVDGVLDPERLAQLPLLEACAKETLRLRPVVPMVVRTLKRPMRIAGLELPEAAMIAPVIYLTHRRPELWESPDAFRPERFLGRKNDPYEFYPFGGGTRRCVGMAFAMYEMRLVLAQIVHRTELALAPRAPDRAVRRGITLAPSAGVEVVLRERRARDWDAASVNAADERHAPRDRSASH